MYICTLYILLNYYLHYTYLNVPFYELNLRNSVVKAPNNIINKFTEIVLEPLVEPVSPPPPPPVVVELAAVEFEAVELAAVELAAVELAVVELAAVELAVVELAAVELAVVELVAVELAAVELAAVELVAVELAAVELAAVELVFEAVELAVEAVELAVVELAVPLELLALELLGVAKLNAFVKSPEYVRVARPGRGVKLNRRLRNLWIDDVSYRV